jgi:FkbM family methyltransferase
MKKTSLNFFSLMIFCFLLPINLTALSYSLVDCYGRPIDHRIIQKMNLMNGVFIEVGANDGVTQSNTKLLEECYGWKGILVEPSNNLFAKLKANRPTAYCFQCALGTFQQNNTYIFGDFDGSLMSSVNGNRLNRTGDQKVLVRSLQSILDEVGIRHVNFFSLDTEGYELNILQGIDFSKTTFDYFLIEIYPAEQTEIVNLLASHGYELVENFSNYNHVTNPRWDGTHNDYLFIRSALITR